MFFELFLHKYTGRRGAVIASIKINQEKKQNQETNIQYTGYNIRNREYPKFSLFPGVEDIKNILKYEFQIPKSLSIASKITSKLR